MPAVALYDALLEGGEDGPSKESLVALSRALLFYAAQARPGCSATDNLRARFGLEQLIPDREALLRARGAVTGRDAELFHSIGEAVREELAVLAPGGGLILGPGCALPPSAGSWPWE